MIITAKIKSRWLGVLRCAAARDGLGAGAAARSAGMRVRSGCVALSGWLP